MRSQLYTPTTWSANLAPQLKAWATLLANETASNSTLAAVPSHQLDLRIHHARQNSNTSVAPIVQEMISHVSLYALQLCKYLISFFRAVVITCLDSIDQEHVQTNRVFEEVVRVTNDQSQMCKFLGLVQSHSIAYAPLSWRDSSIVGQSFLTPVGSIIGVAHVASAGSFFLSSFPCAGSRALHWSFQS
jgi:hypothetical protein